jgi:hypothetical protein
MITEVEPHKQTSQQLFQQLNLQGKGEKGTKDQRATRDKGDAAPAQAWYHNPGWWSLIITMLGLFVAVIFGGIQQTAESSKCEQITLISGLRKRK